MKELFDLTGKVTVITGAGGVLCGTIAKALAKAGAKIAVWDINEEAAVRVVDEIKAGEGTAAAIKCNVLDKKSLQTAKGKTIAELGEIVIGERPGRTDPEEITIVDLTGVGALDAAVANLVTERALANGVGTPFKP